MGSAAHRPLHGAPGVILSLDYIEQDWGGAADLALARMATAIDIRSILPSIRVPTLVVNRSGDLRTVEAGARWMAAQIPGARYIVLPGNDHIPFLGDQDAILDEIEEF